MGWISLFDVRLNENTTGRNSRHGVSGHIVARVSDARIPATECRGTLWRGRGSKVLSVPVGQANRGGVIFFSVFLTTKRALMPDKLAWGERGDGQEFPRRLAENQTLNTEH